MGVVVLRISVTSVMGLRELISLLVFVMLGSMMMELIKIASNALLNARLVVLLQFNALFVHSGMY